MVADHINSESSHSRAGYGEELGFGEVITALVPSLIGLLVVSLIVVAALW